MHVPLVILPVRFFTETEQKNLLNTEQSPCTKMFTITVFILEKAGSHRITQLVCLSLMFLCRLLFCLGLDKAGQGKLVFSFLSKHILVESVHNLHTHSPPPTLWFWS